MAEEILLDNIKMDFDMDNLRISVKQMNYGVFTEAYTKHCHGKNYYELHLVCDGQGRLITENDKYLLEKGMMYMTGPGIFHEQLTNKQMPMQEYCFGFELRKRRNLSDTTFSKSLVETSFWIGKDTGECERLFEFLARELKSRLIGCTHNIRNTASAILVELVRQYTGSRRENELIHSVPDDRRMRIVDSYFVYHYAQVSEEGLGQILGLSSRQVQRFLKKNYGKTFSEMKREAKMNKAHELIRNGMSIENAAAQVGYSSTAFFRKQLKRGHQGQVHLTPVSKNTI